MGGRFLAGASVCECAVSGCRSLKPANDNRMRASFFSCVAALVGVVAFVGPLAAKASPRPQAASRRYQIKGVVKDESGAVVTGAQVTLYAGSYQVDQPTGPDGRFDFSNVPAPNGRLAVNATGFAAVERVWRMGARQQSLSLVIVLRPAAEAQQVTVTATRMETPLSQTTADVRVLTQSEIAATPALTIDGVLQQVPGFTLFRRTGSRVANPTKC